MAVYVGNLPSIATDDQISRRFGQHGTVHPVALINDRETGRFCMSRQQIADGYDLLVQFAQLQRLRNGKPL
jgi:hypothetical protein